MNDECRKFLIEQNLKLNYDSAENVPLIFNGYPIGIVKKYYDNFVECILWDQFTGVSAEFGNGRNGIIKSVVINTKDEKNM